MKIKGIIEEDFVNYKKPSLFIGTCECDFKCCKEGNFDIEVCQNQPLVKAEIINIPDEKIYKQYISNLITQAVVIGGLEPFLQFDEVCGLIKYFRNQKCNDDFVIYTGYYREEIEKQLIVLSQFKNIIIKFGRFKPNQEPHLDEVLGVELASINQYACKIS